MMYTYYNGLMTILIDTAERMHELLAHLKELMTAALWRAIRAALQFS